MSPGFLFCHVKEAYIGLLPKKAPFGARAPAVEMGPFTKKDSRYISSLEQILGANDFKLDGIGFTGASHAVAGRP